MKTLKNVKLSIGGWLRNNQDARPTTMALAMSAAIGAKMPTVTQKEDNFKLSVLSRNGRMVSRDTPVHRLEFNQ